jgi:hypothetical protein
MENKRLSEKRNRDWKDDYGDGESSLVETWQISATTTNSRRETCRERETRKRAKIPEVLVQIPKTVISWRNFIAVFSQWEWLTRGSFNPL